MTYAAAQEHSNTLMLIRNLEMRIEVLQAENTALRALIRNLLPGQVQLDAIRTAEEALGDAQ